MKAQNAANNHNRYQTLENSSVNQLQPNPQARHYDADVVNEYNAGSQAYYFKGVPVTTVVSPVIFPAIAITNNSDSLPDVPVSPFIYRFVYTGTDSVLNYIPLLTSGTLNVSSSYIKNGTTYTVTVNLVSFVDDGTTTDGISFKNVASFYNTNTTGLTITQFGSISLSRGGFQFTKLSDLTIQSNPQILSNTSLFKCFNEAFNFNSDITGWNTVTVTNMSNMFLSAGAFNQPIGSWNTSAVTDMEGMFRDTGLFNQNINSWNTSAVTNMANMFRDTVAFNQNINSWNTSAVTNMNSMFGNSNKFNQPIGSWNTSAVITMNGMFDQAKAFNQNISYSGSGPIWNTSHVTNMGSMFYQNRIFNNGQGVNGTTAPLNWNTDGIIIPVPLFRIRAVLTSQNAVNNKSQCIG